MKKDFRWRLVSVQSKLFSLITLASMTLAPIQPAFAAFGDGTPTISNASVFGEAIDQDRIDGASGAFTQKIPLDIPPGRNGLQPDVSLQYNSQNTSDGIIGYGWSLSIPYIQRLNKTGSQNLYGSNTYFTSSTEGELVATTTPGVITIGSTSTPYVETGTNGPTGWAQCGNSSSQTFSKTVSATSTLLLVHVVSSLVTSVTYAGVSMSIATSTGGNSTWYLTNPTSGTNNVVVTFSGAFGSMGSAVSYTGTDTSNPFGAMSINRANSGNPSVAITTTNDNSIIDDHLYYDVGQTVTSNSPQVSQITEQCGSGPNESHGAGIVRTTTHGSNTLGWTHSSSDSDWQELAVEVRAPSNQSSGASTVSGYSARVDDGSFNSYSFSGNTWTVYDKRGTRYLYGSDDSGRQYDTSTGTSTKTYKWMLQEVRDTNGNYIKYTYTKDSNELYPSQIIYAGSGSSDGPLSVTFATSTRPDVRVSYAAGFSVTTNKRISEIDALVNGLTVRKYPLTYGTGENCPQISAYIRNR